MSAPQPEQKVADSRYLTPEEKLCGWRLLCLIDAHRKGAKKYCLDLEEIELLGRIAQARTDLHEAVDTLTKGCRLEYAVILYS